MQQFAIVEPSFGESRARCHLSLIESFCVNLSADMVSLHHPLNGSTLCKDVDLTRVSEPSCAGRLFCQLVFVTINLPRSDLKLGRQFVFGVVRQKLHSNFSAYFNSGGLKETIDFRSSPWLCIQTVMGYFRPIMSHIRKRVCQHCQLA